MEDNLPKHVVIIPDGNRRWAKSHGLNPWESYEEGASNMEKIVRLALKLGIKAMSFWGSSIGNFKKRPLREKQELLKIYKKYFLKLINGADVHDNEVRINIIGRWSEQFPNELKKILEDGMKKTACYKKRLLNFFLAYSGDDEMIEAVKTIAKNYKKGQKIISDTIKRNLMTRDLPAVDLLIRTGGEPHLSAGFMMWDIANAQLYFSEKYFPDFKEEQFQEAVEEYKRRERRFGK